VAGFASLLYDVNATWPTNPSNNYSTDVQAEITRNSWNKAQADAYVAFLANPSVPGDGLVLWLKADAGVKDSNGSPAVNNGSVGTWQDQSFYQNNANQGTSGNQLTFITSRSDLNNKPVVRFNGSSSWLDITDNSSLRLANVTVIAVAQTHSTAQQDLVCHGLDSNYLGDQRWPNYSYDLGIAANNGIWGALGYTWYHNIQAGNTTNVEDDLSGPTNLPENMSIWTMVYDGANANGNGTKLEIL
jgi:hypothetical protein